MLRKVSGTLRLARTRSRRKNSQNSIVAHTLDSHDLNAFWQWIDETVGEEGSRNTKQQEFRKMMKNWKSLDPKCLMKILEFLRGFGESLLQLLKIVIVFSISVIIRALYSGLITS